ncbi:MAG: hypothetical protein ACRD2C_05165 [Acidimicrobiales bacterium]
MAAEMPARVDPAENAAEVDFPWGAATTAVAALNAAGSTLASQLGARPPMVDTLVDWEGTYRQDFDVANHRITTTASGLREELARKASAIASAAEDANEEQRQNNLIVDDDRTGLTGPRRGRV